MESRLRAAHQLKWRVEALVGKELCVTARDIGLGEMETAAKIDNFFLLGRGDWVGGAEPEALEGTRAGARTQRGTMRGG